MERTITITKEEAITLAGAILTRQEFAKKLKGDALADAGSEKFIQLYDEELHRLDDLLARIWGGGAMSILSLERSNARSKRGLASRRKVAIGLLVLSVVWNIGQAARINRLEVSRMEAAALLIQAERTRDAALNDLEKLTIRTERMQRTAATPAVVREAVDAYQYIGECVITAYCPCEVCCGQWADGLTATGIPAEPGVVAVDPEVIPLGSVVVIGGQRYLAADTGVKGLHVDICAASHEEAVAFGVQSAEVRVVER